MTISGTCHCGATRFTLESAPTQAIECNCTFCSKAGGLWAYYTPEQLVVERADGEGVYSQSGYNKHHFCATCGCQTYGTSPEWSLDGQHDMDKVKVGINVRLLDDFDMSKLAIIPMDGRNLW